MNPNEKQNHFNNFLQNQQRIKRRDYLPHSDNCPLCTNHRYIIDQHQANNPGSGANKRSAPPIPGAAYSAIPAATTPAAATTASENHDPATGSPTATSPPPSRHSTSNTDSPLDRDPVTQNQDVASKAGSARIVIPGIIPVQENNNNHSDEHITFPIPPLITADLSPSQHIQEYSEESDSYNQPSSPDQAVMGILQRSKSKSSIPMICIDHSDSSEEEFDVLVSRRETFQTPRRDQRFTTTVSTSSYETPLRKMAVPGLLPSFSPSDLSKEREKEEKLRKEGKTLKRQHRSMEELFRKSMKLRKSLKYKVMFPGGIETEGKVYCGNESISIEVLTARDIGELYKGRFQPKIGNFP